VDTEWGYCKVDIEKEILDTGYWIVKTGSWILG